MSPPDPDATDRAEWVRTALTRHEAPLLRYVLSLVGDPDRARDIVQDTFLRLCAQEPDAVRGHLAQWLFTVARNRALDWHRKERRMSPLEDAVHHALALLDRLPRNQREVVRLKFQNQLSYQEIAAVTSLSVGNVGFLLHTALKTLRRDMEALERAGLPARTA
jgi:DNA-directed RNA polymerase specialized sigma24 family protein